MIMRSGYSTIFAFRFGRCRVVWLEAAQHCFDPGYQLLGIKGFDHIVVSAQLQSQDLVEDLALGGKHDDRGRWNVWRISLTDLIAVHAGKHQIQKDQVRVRRCQMLCRACLAVVNDLWCRRHSFGEVEGDQLCDIAVIVHNQ